MHLASRPRLPHILVISRRSRYLETPAHTTASCEGAARARSRNDLRASWISLSKGCERICANISSNRLRIPQHLQIFSLALVSSPRAARTAARVVSQIKWRCYCGRAEACIFYTTESKVSQDISLFLKERHHWTRSCILLFSLRIELFSALCTRRAMRDVIIAYT